MIKHVTLLFNSVRFNSVQFHPTRRNSGDIKQALQLLDERPLVIADVGPVKLLQGVDALPGDERVERVLFLPVAAVDGLVGAFDLDGDGGLAAFHHGDLFVIALDGLAVVCRGGEGKVSKAFFLFSDVQVLGRRRGRG